MLSLSRLFGRQTRSRRLAQAATKLGPSRGAAQPPLQPRQTHPTGFLRRLSDGINCELSDRHASQPVPQVSLVPLQCCFWRESASLAARRGLWARRPRSVVPSSSRHENSQHRAWRPHLKLPFQLERPCRARTLAAWRGASPTRGRRVLHPRRGGPPNLMGSRRPTRVRRRRALPRRLLRKPSMVRMHTSGACLRQTDTDV